MTPPQVAPGPPHYAYAATVLDVHDGDTLTAAIDIGLLHRGHDRDLGLHLHLEGGRLRLHWPIRLKGINAAELATPAGQQARSALASVIPPATTVLVATHLDQLEKYGRLLGDVVRLADGLHVNQWLIDNGYAAAWSGQGPRPVP